MPIGGFANRVARVDLSSGAVSYEPIPEDWARKYIGARGLGVRYVLENGPDGRSARPGQPALLHERPADRAPRRT